MPVRSSHATLAEHPLVKDFLKSAKRRSSTAKPLLPSWDLSLVLEARCGPPFGPLESLDLRVLTFEMVFIQAMTMAKRISNPPPPPAERVNKQSSKRKYSMLQFH